MRIFALIMLLSCVTTVSARSLSYTATEQEALRVLSKHKALFTLVPQRIAEILKVVRLHSHTEPSQRLTIVHETIRQVQSKYAVIMNIRDAVKRTRREMAPYIRTAILNEFKALGQRLKKYKKTLKRTMAMLNDEAGKLLVASGGVPSERKKNDRAFKAARAVLAVNHIDTLVGAIAGKEADAPPDQTGLFAQMSNQIAQLQQQITTMTTAFAQGARTLSTSFADKLAQAGKSHTAIFNFDDAGALQEYDTKKAQKRLKKEQKRQRKEERRKEKAELQRIEKEEARRKKAIKKEQKKKKEKQRQKEIEEAVRRAHTEHEEKDRQRRMREAAERKQYEEKQHALLAREKERIRAYEQRVKREREDLEHELRRQEEDRWHAAQEEQERERTARDRHEAAVREYEERAHALKQEQLRLEHVRSELREKEQQHRIEKEYAVMAERKRIDKKIEDSVREQERPQEVTPSGMLRQELAHDALHGYRLIRAGLERIADCASSVAASIRSRAADTYQSARSFWTIQPVRKEQVVQAQKQADRVVMILSDKAHALYDGVRSGALHAFSQPHAALVAGGMLSTHMPPAGQWALTGRLKSASMLDPSRVIEKPLLPEHIAASYTGFVRASGDAVGRVKQYVKERLSASGALLHRGGGKVYTWIGSLWRMPFLKQKKKQNTEHASASSVVRMGAHIETRTNPLAKLSHWSRRFLDVMYHGVEAAGTPFFRVFTFLWNRVGGALDLFETTTVSALSRTRDASWRGIAALRDRSVRFGAQARSLMTPVADASYHIGDAMRAYWGALVGVPSFLWRSIKYGGALLAQVYRQVASFSLKHKSISTARAVRAGMHSAGQRVQAVGHEGKAMMQNGWAVFQKAGSHIGTTVRTQMHATIDTMKNAKFSDQTKKFMLQGLRRFSNLIGLVKQRFTTVLAHGVAGIRRIVERGVLAVRTAYAWVRGKSLSAGRVRPAYMTRRDAREGMKRIQKLVQIRAQRDLRARTACMPDKSVAA